MNELNPQFWQGKLVLLLGASGFLGSHLKQSLDTLESPVLFTPTHQDYDLCDEMDVKDVLRRIRPDIIIHAAGNVGGIGANQAHPAEFFFNNLKMGMNVINLASVYNIAKVVMIGTTCSYPRDIPIPFKEEDLWNGEPEKSNLPYGIAKRTLVTMAQAYRQQYGLNAITLLPANLYGERDSFDESKSHVIPALIKKCIEAREQSLPYITVWGDGTPTREFLYVEDAVRGILLATEQYNDSAPVNLGTSDEVSIQQLVGLICRFTKYMGDIRYDKSKPNGQPRRKLDVTKARDKFGFEAEVRLEEGLRRTIEWYEQERLK